MVPEQVWVEPPEPRVSVTGWPDSDVPLVVRLPDRVMGWPLVVEVGPVYVMRVLAGVTVRVPEFVLPVNGSGWLASPVKLPDTG